MRGYEINRYDKCSNCHNHIRPGMYLIEDVESFTISVGELVAKKISETEIGECQNCNENIILFTQRHGDLLELTNVYELVEGYGFESDISSEIYSNIFCSCCGNNLGSDDPYVTTEEVDNWYSDDVEIVISTFKDVTEKEGQDFMNFLLKNPMLGLNHPLGKKIFLQIKNEEIPNILTLQAGNKFLRGRKRKNKERLAAYIPDELWNPPEGISSQGRYNPPLRIHRKGSDNQHSNS